MKHSPKPSLHIILGPTAVGKTEFAIHMAKQKNGEIISADSMQVYRGMNIGTGKPSMGEREGVPHYLIDIRNPDEHWTVVDFLREAEQCAADIAARGKLPIIVGGTGFYLWSFLNNLTFPEIAVDLAVRDKLRSEASNKGAAYMYERLRKCDPASAQRIHANDTKRIVRALEIYERMGKPVAPVPQGPPAKEKYALHVSGLTMPREKLYERINVRVDKFVERGLVEEVRGLLNKGISSALPCMQALGYKEAVEYIQGSWDHKKMVDELKKRTRNFAKRQYVWFKRFEDVEWIEGR